ncbi:MAG: class I SAM-dependent methyltransferase [Acidobacteria bacterium]|nr:class I SAM-dependent methyltransferase [Acidobacteriota bacterium]
MGAATHLGINLGDYDAVIRTLIPHYQELIGAAGAAVGALTRTAPAVVDLGTGSGALAQAILTARPRARLTGIDEDAGMLAMAAKRLRGRITTIHGNFETTPIPRCDVVSASFALHHIRASRRKAALYRRAYAALTRGGLIVSADCCLASTAALQKNHRAGWLAHLRQNYSPARAEGFLSAWAKEDVYFTLEQEMALLKRAGFKVEVAFRKTCFAVVVGLK